MRSVFVEDLKKKGKERINNIHPSMESMETVSSYRRIAKAKSILLAGGIMAAGGLSFFIMGYFLLIWINHSGFRAGSLLATSILGLVVCMASWIVCSIIEYAAWKKISQFNSQKKSEDGLTAFLTVEGMSEIVKVIVLPVFFLAKIVFGVHFATLVLGAAIFLKLVLLWNSYPMVLPNVSNADKTMLVGFSTAGLLIVIYGIRIIGGGL